MKKRATIAVVVSFLMILSTAPAIIEAGETNSPMTQIKELHFEFPEPQILEDNGFITLSVDGTTQTPMGDGGQPILPEKNIVLKFPFGTKIYNVDFKYSTENHMYLNNKIKPAPTPVPYGVETHVKPNYMNEKIYGSSSYYPGKIGVYDIKVGRDENNIKTAYLIINLYPVQYSPKNNEIKYITNADIKIKYEEPTEPTGSFSSYDLLIITAPAYKDEMNRLKTHKESHGISTKVVTTDEINTNGRDLAEKIKKYIYQEDIPHVLLVGGYRSFFGLDKPELQLPLRWYGMTMEENQVTYQNYTTQTPHTTTKQHTPTNLMTGTQMGTVDMERTTGRHMMI